MKIRWLNEAIDDLDGITTWIAEKDTGRAVAFVARIQSVVQGLLEFPLKGRQSEISGVRELVVPPSIVISYLMSEGEVLILHVFHTSQHRGD